MRVMSSSIAVKHNIEVAHRLFELPGKCEQIHGHSMWVTMELTGRVNDKGILAGIEYGDLKKMFRGHLDEEYDHRLLLNASDPFARPIYPIVGDELIHVQQEGSELSFLGEYITKLDTRQVFLPGLQATPGDPTTENLSQWIANAMEERLQEMQQGGSIQDLFTMEVTVWETSVNMAKTVIGLDSIAMQERFNGTESK